jgi:hypothetical protein
MNEMNLAINDIRNRSTDYCSNPTTLLSTSGMDTCGMNTAWGDMMTNITPATDASKKSLSSIQDTDDYLQYNIAKSTNDELVKINNYNPMDSTKKMYNVYNNIQDDLTVSTSTMKQQNDYISLNTARFCQAQGMINEREIGHVNPGALFPGDSIEFPLGMLYEVVHQQNYLTGDNIVVIWPRVEVLDPQVNEHLTTQIHVLNNSMISSLNDAIKIKENSFYFLDKTIHFLNKFPVSEVVLYNMLGNEVYQSNSQFLKKINLQNTPSGTYLLVIRLTDGTIRKEKLVVQ